MTLPGGQVPTVEDAMMAATAAADGLDAESDPISQVINQLPERDPKG